MRFVKITSSLLAVVYLFSSAYIFGIDNFLCIRENGVAIESAVNANCKTNPLADSHGDAINSEENYASSENDRSCVDFSLTGINGDNRYQSDSKKRLTSEKTFPHRASLAYFPLQKAELTLDYLNKTHRIRSFTLKMLRTTILIV